MPNNVNRAKNPIELICASVLNRKIVLAYIKAYFFAKYTGLHVTATYHQKVDNVPQRWFTIKSIYVHLKLYVDSLGYVLKVEEVYVSSDIKESSYLFCFKAIAVACLFSPVDTAIYDTIAILSTKE